MIEVFVIILLILDLVFFIDYLDLRFRRVKALERKVLKLQEMVVKNSLAKEGELEGSVSEKDKEIQKRSQERYNERKRRELGLTRGDE